MRSCLLSILCDIELEVCETWEEGCRLEAGTFNIELLGSLCVFNGHLDLTTHPGIHKFPNLGIFAVKDLSFSAVADKQKWTGERLLLHFPHHISRLVRTIVHKECGGAGAVAANSLKAS